MWGKNCTTRQTTDDNTIWRGRNACWITTAINTQSEYVIFIAFPRQQWLRERVCVTLQYIASGMLTLILLTWTIWRAPTNASKWRMGFNSAFKGLIRSWNCGNTKQKMDMRLQITALYFYIMEQYPSTIATYCM